MSHVDGDDDGAGYGVRGRSDRVNGFGVIGQSDRFDGVHGVNVGGSGVGVSGFSLTGGDGVFGRSRSGRGVFGWSNDRDGVQGLSFTANGVSGSSMSGPGVFGLSGQSSGVHGFSSQSIGVFGFSSISDGLRGISDGTGDGVLGYSYNGIGVHGVSSFGYAAWLDGRVFIRGPLQKPGGQFKIDHPLDPANKYLSHSFVESPDMKNIYDGVVTLDNDGEAEIELPEWIVALNKDFRYQLTPIGAPGPNLHIAKEISDADTHFSNSNNRNKKSRFRVAGGAPGMKVSWHVTGIRKDPWANAHRIQVEEDKPDEERGHYIYPELYGQPVENRMGHLLVPEIRERAAINENK
jgi:hypothetical protein